MRFGLLGAVTRGVRRYVIFSELNFVVPTLVKKSGPANFDARLRESIWSNDRVSCGSVGRTLGSVAVP